MEWNENEMKETKRCETRAVGGDWPWRARGVWGCSSASERWRCLPRLPVQLAALCGSPQGWRGGSRRSRYWGHYWPERRRNWRRRWRRSGGQDAGWEWGWEEMERVRMGWKTKQSHKKGDDEWQREVFSRSVWSMETDGWRTGRAVFSLTKVK